MAIRLGSHVRASGTGHWEVIERTRTIHLVYRDGLACFAEYDRQADLLILQFAGSEVKLPFIRDE